ncbi:MAG TPA: serine hydrolase [Gaiellaceae bacterium]|nr:serine hydrolase [Gaiellaceae bacterium]
MKLLTLAALALVAAAPNPDALQASYDGARDREERALRSGDRAAAARAHAEVLAAERHDHRPSSWRGSRDSPGFAVPPVARAERSKDEALAARLAALGSSYRGWSAFWVHDLSNGTWAGWNSDARFPAASTVKLGVLAEALRRGERPGSPLWYDLRQLAGWSSNLAANRVARRVGGERVVEAALRRLGARASTYPGPYRAGTAVSSDAPKPPPQGHVRVTTAHDLGRILYALHAAAAGNRHVQRTADLTRTQAARAIALLVHSTSGGMVQPFAHAPTAHKEGWISDTRATAAIVYGQSPRIVVVLAYRPGITEAEARSLGKRVAALTLH